VAIHTVNVMPLSLDIIISGVAIHTVNVMPLSLDIIISTILKVLLL
jgi:hypothetical protein